jgi:hypothetical protein
MSRNRNRRRPNPNTPQPQAPKIRFTHKISDHFSKKDFIFTTDGGDQKLKVSMGLVGGLELLRSLAKKRITITKGYITPEAAEREGNWKRNYHPLGLAADIRIEGMSNEEVFILAESVPEFKGIGLSIDGDHVHVDTRKTAERSLWVETNAQMIDLTPALREKYNLIPRPPVDITPQESDVA